MLIIKICFCCYCNYITLKFQLNFKSYKTKKKSYFIKPSDHFFFKDSLDSLFTIYLKKESKFLIMYP